METEEEMEWILAQMDQEQVREPMAGQQPMTEPPPSYSQTELGPYPTKEELMYAEMLRLFGRPRRSMMHPSGGNRNPFTMAEDEPKEHEVYGY